MNERCAQWAQATNRALCRRGPAAPRDESGHGVDGPLHRARALQLAPAVLPARRGVTLSWVGTGRCLGTMDFTDKDYEALRLKLIDAAGRMQADGWWLGAEHPRRERSCGFA